MENKNQNDLKATQSVGVTETQIEEADKLVKSIDWGRAVSETCNEMGISFPALTQPCKCNVVELKETIPDRENNTITEIYDCEHCNKKTKYVYKLVKVQYD